MLTNISIYIADEFETDDLKKVVASLCDVLTDEGLANSGDADDGITSVVVVRLYEEEDLTGALFEESIMSVLPIAVN